MWMRLTIISVCAPRINPIRGTYLHFGHYGGTVSAHLNESSQTFVLNELESVIPPVSTPFLCS